MSTVKVTNIQHGSATNVAMVLDTAGTVKAYSTIGVGNTTPAASGAGISFPATASASSDANTLDDYEEGTWTPEFGSGSGASTGGSTTVNAAIYTKIGRMVYASCDISIATKGSLNGSDIAQIWGLPFSLSNSESGSGAVNYFNNLNQNVNWIGFTGQSGTTSLLFRITTAAAASISNGTWTNLYQNGTRVFLTIVYST